MIKNRTYTKEFKKQALDLAEGLKSIPLAAEQLGIPKVNLYAWKSQADLSSTGNISSDSKSINNDDLEELKRLRKEVQELKKVNHILKSAAAFFSQDHLK